MLMKYFIFHSKHCLFTQAWLSVWCFVYVSFRKDELYVLAVIIANMSLFIQAYCNGQPQAYSLFQYLSKPSTHSHATSSASGSARTSLRHFWSLFV